MKLHTIDHFGVVFVSMSKPVCMPNHSHIKMHFAYWFVFMQINSFSYERFCTKTLSETEVQGNSEMAYLLLCVIVLMLLFLILNIINI